MKKELTACEKCGSFEQYDTWQATETGWVHDECKPVPKVFEFTLKWSGRPDSEMVQLAFAHCKKQIPICKDICEFITHQRYLELIAAEKIAGPTKYWGINQFEVGMICLSSYANSYERSWEDLSHCYRDFIAGYEACEKKYTYLCDWDEALEHETKRNQYLKKQRRTITFFFNADHIDRHDVQHYDLDIDIVETRNGKRKIRIVGKCTGPEFAYRIYNLCYYTGIQMPELENPLDKENHVSSMSSIGYIKKTAKVAKH